MLRVNVQNGTMAGIRHVHPQNKADWRCPGCKGWIRYYWAKCPNCAHPRTHDEA